MLDRVEVRNSAGDQLILPLEDASDGYQIEDIAGLGPVKATLVSSSFAGFDGSQYQSSRREPRNLVFKVELLPDYAVETMETLRQRLYRYFMTKREVFLTFVMESGLELDISGRVETCEPDLFAKEQIVDVSIICFKPDLIDLVPVTITGTTVSDDTETLITYDGTVETGILFKMLVDRDISTFTIYHRLPDNTVRTLEFAGDMHAGDILTISTVPGSKYATLTSGGVDSPILNGVSPYSNWIELFPGDNNLRVYAEGVGVPVEIEYTTKYGGL